MFTLAKVTSRNPFQQFRLCCTTKNEGKDRLLKRLKNEADFNKMRVASKIVLGFATSVNISMNIPVEVIGGGTIFLVGASCLPNFLNLSGIQSVRLKAVEKDVSEEQIAKDILANTTMTSSCKIRLLESSEDEK
jgi:hypothetical protein